MVGRVVRGGKKRAQPVGAEKAGKKDLEEKKQAKAKKKAKKKKKKA